MSDEPFGGDVDAQSPFVIDRAQAECESSATFPQGVGGEAVDRYVAAALERMRARNDETAP